MIYMIRPRLIHSCCPLLLSLIGCASTPVTSDEAARQQALSLLMPRSIEIVESFSPGPYLELFARHEREGWCQWGDECPNGESLQFYSARNP